LFDVNLKRKYLYLLNKKIKLNQDISWLIGFYFAEGSKTRDGIGFANAEIVLVKKMLKIFSNNFDIPVEDWRCYVKTSKKDINIIQNLNKEIPNVQFELSYSKLATKENLDFRINSRVLSRFMSDYFKKSMQQIMSNSCLSTYFLSGYSIGDGGVILRDKQIHGVVITVKNKEYFNYLIKICDLLYKKKPNVRMTKGCYEISYCHVNIISNIILDKIFIDLDRQWTKLILGYKNKQYTRARIKYWNKIENELLDSFKIAKLSGNSHWSVRDALNKDIDLGLVNAEYKYINNSTRLHKCYYLTHKGKTLLGILKEVN